MEQTRIKILTCKIILFAVAAATLSGCGAMSNAIDITFNKQKEEETQAPKASSPSFGLSVAHTKQVSGQYEFRGNIGNQLPSIVKSSGQYKFYGGIQGQLVSK